MVLVYSFLYNYSTVAEVGLSVWGALPHWDYRDQFVTARSLPITAKIEPMGKVARIFKSFAEADAADAKEDLHISPEKRIEILLEL